MSEPDRGQSHALNKGFATARGEILGWLNADDHYLPEAVAEGVRALEETGAGLVYADVTRVDDDGVNPRRIRSRPTWDLWTELNAGCGIYSPSVFFTREALDAAGEPRRDPPPDDGLRPLAADREAVPRARTSTRSGRCSASTTTRRRFASTTSSGRSGSP